MLTAMSNGSNNRDMSKIQLNKLNYKKNEVSHGHMSGANR